MATPVSSESADEHVAAATATSSIWRVGAIAVLVTVVGIGGVFVWRWRVDRAYVGTEVPATVTWGGCFNGVYWTDPSSNVLWWAGSKPVVNGAIETEPARRTAEGGVAHLATGTMRFDSYDRSTFTNTAGGTMGFIRPPPNITDECRLYPPGHLNNQQPPGIDYGTGVHGTLSESGGPAPGLPKSVGGTVRATANNAVMATTTTADGKFELSLPAGTYTVVGHFSETDCPGIIVTVIAGQIATADITCPIK